MKKELTKGQAVKAIFNIIRDYGYGLPESVEKYNYLSCFGDVSLTSEMIKNYFKGVKE